MDEKRNGCEVCFHDFDRRERKPRVVPCGHTFCSKCVCDNYKENVLVCSICRKEHHAETVADFPVNFIFENILFEAISIPSTSDEMSNQTTDQPKAISKKLKSMTIELCSGVENKATNNKEVRSQLHHYENLLSEKKILHHQIKENHSAIAQRNDDIIQIIRKERARIADTLKEEEEEAQRMKIVTDKLHAATTPQEVFLSMEDATVSYDFLERWNQETQEIFPNIQLLTKSVMLFEKSQIMLQTLPNCRGDTAAEEPTEVTPTDHSSENMASLSIDGLEASSESPNENDSPIESSLLNPKLSIQEKVTRALQNASISKQIKAPVKDVDEKSVQAETNTTLTELISKGSQTKTPVKDIDEKSVQTVTAITLTELISKGSQTETPVKDIDEKSVQTVTNTKLTGLISKGSQTETPVKNIDEKSVQTETNTTLTGLISKGSQTKIPMKDVDEKSVQTETNTTLTGLISKGIRKQDPTPSIECLRMRMESVMELMNQKRLFAVQEFEGRRRFAQISLQEKNRIVLHSLKDQELPSNAHLLQHCEVMKLVNLSSRLVFLELWCTQKKTLGKLFIRLFPYGKRAQQFALLCSGQNGPSYVDSRIVQLFSKGTNNECLQCGDYEKLGGRGGRAMVPDVLKGEGGVFKQPCMEGTIRGYSSYSSELTAAQFILYTRDNPEHELDCCFGMVEEGLPILQDAIDNHEDIRRVTFSDAGLVLDI